MMKDKNLFLLALITSMIIMVIFIYKQRWRLMPAPAIINLHYMKQMFFVKIKMALLPAVFLSVFD